MRHDLDQAELLFRVALEIEERLDLKEGMVIEHYNLGHWDVAKEHFEAAVKADPKLAEAHYNLALAFHKLGAHAEATAHFKEAAELAPSNTAITDSSAYWSHVRSSRDYGGYGGYGGMYGY